MDDLRQRLTDRLAVLVRETDLGEERLRALENEVVVLRRTLLRIAGATQVLREVLDETDPPGPADSVRMEPAESGSR
jgi:hypothetical protein